MIIVAEITVTVDAAGTTSTFYVTSGAGFATKPSDTPASTFVAPRLINPGNWRRELFSGNRTVGPVRMGFGEVVLTNADGELDVWCGYGFATMPIVFYGIEGDPSDATFPDDWTLLFSATMESATFGMRDVRITLRDRLSVLDRPVCQQTYAGTGGVEGGSDMTGKRKPVGYGMPDWISPPLVDASLKMFHASTTGIADGLVGVYIYDGGVALTDSTDYTDETDMLTSTPSAGEYRMLRPDGFFRLGSDPDYQITMRRLLTRYASPTKVSTCIQHLLDDAGLTTSDYSSSDISTIAADANMVTAAYYNDGTKSDTFINALEEICRHGGIWFGPDKSGVLRFKQFTGPAVSADHTLGRHDLIGIVRIPAADTSAPVWRVVINCWRNYSPGGGISDALTVAEVAARKTEWHQVAAYDEDVLTQYPGAAELTLEMNGNGDSLSTSRVQSEAERLLALHKVQRSIYMVDLPLTVANLSIDLGETVELTYPRFDLASGKNLIVVAQRADMARGVVNLSLWG